MFQKVLPLTSLMVVVGLLIAAVVGVTPAHADGKCQSDEIQISIGLGSGVKNEGTNASPIYCVPKNTGNSNLSQNPIFVWIVDILAFMTPVVGIAVTGGIVWGAITYITAGGNAAQTKKAIGIITNSIVSLVLFILLFAIINFVVPGGVLTK